MKNSLSFITFMFNLRVMSFKQLKTANTDIKGMKRENNNPMLVISKL